MIKEIQAKTILSHSNAPDPWLGIQYTMNLYRGCQHQCIYCDSRSDCYPRKTQAMVSFTITTCDDHLEKKVEPRWSASSRE